MFLKRVVSRNVNREGFLSVKNLLIIISGKEQHIFIEQREQYYSTNLEFNILSRLNTDKFIIILSIIIIITYATFAKFKLFFFQELFKGNGLKECDMVTASGAALLLDWLPTGGLPSGNLIPSVIPLPRSESHRTAGADLCYRT